MYLRNVENTLPRPMNWRDTHWETLFPALGLCNIADSIKSGI